MSRQVLRRIFTTASPLHRAPPAPSSRYLSTSHPLHHDLDVSTSTKESQKDRSVRTHAKAKTNTSWIQEQERQKLLGLREKYIPDIVQQIDRQVAQVDDLLRSPRNEHELEKLQEMKRQLTEARAAYERADQQLLDVLDGKY